MGIELVFMFEFTSPRYSMEVTIFSCSRLNDKRAFPAYQVYKFNTPIVAMATRK